MSEHRMPLGVSNALNLSNSPPPRKELHVLAMPNALKRSLDSESHDASFTEIERPFKRARIQSTPSPKPPRIPMTASPILADSKPCSPASPVSVVPTHAASTKVYPSPANSSPLKSPKSQPNLHPAKSDAPLRRIDFATFKPNPAAPVRSFSARPPRRARTHANDAHYDGTTQLDLPMLDLPPPRTSIAELLRAQRPDACVFIALESYRDKVFSCKKIPNL
ncbi:hypothetical protein B0H11DRAFT_957850 [Mycena galericulata]|nr:hypothetical protein B0H11DRAFT_957850 [Mycena galericulata]